jgi:uroporphyrinogen-III synthase
MRVLVTRPEPECAAWVQGLRARGVAAAAWPLIRIGPVRDPAAVHRCWRQLAGFEAVMAVSGAAVEHFFALRPPDTPLPSGLRFWAPGPGTRAALERLQVPASRIDAPAAASGQFDSEALWRVVGPTVKPGWRVLIVRGGDASPEEDAPASSAGQGREWLAQTLGQAGARVELVMAYERGAVPWTASQRAEAAAACSDGSLWLFTSSQAIAHLAAALAGQTLAQARALATHPRIAEAARAAGFGRVWETRPRLDDVVASIESIA